MTSSTALVSRTSSQYGYHQAILSGTFKTPKAMQSLIEDAANSSHRSTKTLAKHILKMGSLKVTAQKHAGGFGGQGRGADSKPHYTVQAQGKHNLTVHIYTKSKVGQEFISGIKR